MVTSECTVSPPIVSICIRCVWSMLGVKYSYLKYKTAVYQYVGQCTTGKDQLYKHFVLSPSYSYFSHIDDPEKRLEMKQSKKIGSGVGCLKHSKSTLKH